MRSEQPVLSSSEEGGEGSTAEQPLPSAGNFKLIISYDGTAYHGWQRQPGKVTIQGLIEDALRRLTGRSISLQAAGRTDAGVHALGQVANFRAACQLTEADLLRALNALLPPEIRITSVCQMAQDFQARKSARSKVYRYRINTSPVLSPFDYRYVFHYPYPLNKEAMIRAARLFEREDDFTAFSSGYYQYPVRQVYHSVLEEAGQELIFRLKLTAFFAIWSGP